MCIWRKRLVCCLRWSYLIRNGFRDVYTENIGAVENKGFELAASLWLLRDTERRVMRSVTGNLSYNKDKITKLSDAMKSSVT